MAIRHNLKTRDVLRFMAFMSIAVIAVFVSGLIAGSIASSHTLLSVILGVVAIIGGTVASFMAVVRILGSRTP